MCVSPWHGLTCGKTDSGVFPLYEILYFLLDSQYVCTLWSSCSFLDCLTGDLRIGLYRLDRMHMLTKLRPFVHSFLKEAYGMYEMHIYTMAEQSYALEMAKLLDPTGMYFGDRIISQSDSTKRHQKGLDVVVGAENAVLILDDTDGVRLLLIFIVLFE